MSSQAKFVLPLSSGGYASVAPLAGSLSGAIVEPVDSTGAAVASSVAIQNQFGPWADTGGVFIASEMIVTPAIADLIPRENLQNHLLDMGQYHSATILSAIAAAGSGADADPAIRRWVDTLTQSVHTIILPDESSFFRLAHN